MAKSKSKLPTFYPDAEQHSADWPKRTPDRMDDLGGDPISTKVEPIGGNVATAVVNNWETLAPGLAFNDKGDFFKTCERDDKGHCTVGGGGAGKTGESASTPKLDKEKFIGAKVGKAEHVRSAEVEKTIVSAVNGEWEEDNAFYDGKTKDNKHFLEIKSLLKGSKNSISVHPDALLRKIEGVKQNKGSTFHTIVVDDRETYDGGAHSDKYSGHKLYYKRGSGRYALSKMHQVKDEGELNRLINTPDSKLPDKARGSLPKGAAAAKIKQDAEKAHQSRLNKDRARKARLKAEALSHIQ